MNYNLTPIETVYKGYKFRSRLEARWAVFFEEMRLDWSYEVEGFNLPSGARYLPDFLVKGHKNGWDYYYEIKPKGTADCPKVKELGSILRQNESREYNCYGGGDPSDSQIGQKIYQLNGDPFDCVTGVCPRCKLVNADVFRGYLSRVFFNAHFRCENCDDSKGFCDYFIEEKACEIDGTYFDLTWDKGSMITGADEDGVQDYGTWIMDMHLMAREACLAARQARFDGRATP